MLRKLDENLGVAEQPLKYMGLAVGTRMTVIRLAGDIQRVILAHGHIVESNGTQAFREAYAWL